MELETEVPNLYLEDTIATFVVSKEMKCLWAIQLDLLAKIDSICRKYNIRYSIDSGTLIGAKRHGGFIPWDDDIDVVMPRKDYEKFKEVVADEISGYYYFQTSDNSPGYYRSFGRLLNVKTVAALKADMRNGKMLWKYRQCVFVDILVLDNIPDNMEERKSHFSILQRLHRRYWTARELVKYAANWRIVEKTIGGLYKIFVGSLLLFLSKCGLNLLQRRFRAFDRQLQKYSNLNTKEGAPYTNRPYEIIGLCEFDNLEEVPFEYLSVKAFKNFDLILSKRYGNWRKHVIGHKPDMYYDLTEFLK